MSSLSLLTRFWRGLCTNWFGTAGVVLTTTSFLLFSLMELLRLTRVVTNSYVGLITYLALPALFIGGLLLIPVGWWLYKRRSGRSTHDLLAERFDPRLVKPHLQGSRLIQTILILTLVNVLFFGIGGARMLSFMDQPEFCGTACHSVMGPEWATYQDSPHARVRCVDCHVGQGPDAMIDAKLNGLWQMISVTFNLYDRPIPTPVHNLRPARETCERCHWPEKFYGDRIKRFVRHETDSASTPRYSTLALKVGSGKGEQRGEIHWHVAARNKVRYLAADDARKVMRWVEVQQPGGGVKRYHNRGLNDWDNPPGVKHGPVETSRPMDCVDCHNRATHIYEDPEDAVDQRLASGEIARALPFAKQQALAALTGSFARGPGALASLERGFRGFYRASHPEVAIAMSREIDAAVKTLQGIYQRNIHTTMNITWGAYPDHRGHRRSPGCRRCHSPEMVDEQGKALPHDCTLCHSLLAYDSEQPFGLLMPPDPTNRECRMQLTSRHEFLGITPSEGSPDPCSPPARSAETDQLPQPQL